MILRALIETWRHDADFAGCIDGETGKPCDGVQQCANDLEAALSLQATLVGLVSLRPSDGAIFIGGVMFSKMQARRIVIDLLELLTAPEKLG